MSEIMRLCIIAGSGELPKLILEEAKSRSLYVSVISLKAHAEKSDFSAADSVISLGISDVGTVLEFLRNNKISHIVMAGAVKRPNLASIIPDVEGAKLLSKIVKNKFLGDDNLLRTIVGFFEDKGYKIISSSEFVSEINKDAGVLGDITTDNKANTDIEIGVDSFKIIGKLDVGQSLIVSDGRIISIEGAEGTDEMIKRSKDYLGSHSVLIKLLKDSQDTRVDLPTIGPETIDRLAEVGVNGVAIDENVLILSREDTIKKANLKNIYIFILLNNKKENYGS